VRSGVAAPFAGVGIVIDGDGCRDNDVAFATSATRSHPPRFGVTLHQVGQRRTSGRPGTAGGRAAEGVGTLFFPPVGPGNNDLAPGMGFACGYLDGDATQADFRHIRSAGQRFVR